jgi:hypothetical protein
VFPKALTDRPAKLKNSFAGRDPSIMVLGSTLWKIAAFSRRCAETKRAALEKTK